VIPRPNARTSSFDKLRMMSVEGAAIFLALTVSLQCLSKDEHEGAAPQFGDNK
jgi:hypothetical protein